MDKDALQKAVAAAEAIDAAEYSAASIAEVSAVLGAARTGLADETAGLEEG